MDKTEEAIIAGVEEALDEANVDRGLQQVHDNMMEVESWLFDLFIRRERASFNLQVVGNEEPDPIRGCLLAAGPVRHEGHKRRVR